jgi:hypothetical protein
MKKIKHICELELERKRLSDRERELKKVIGGDWNKVKSMTTVGNLKGIMSSWMITSFLTYLK